MSDYLNAERIKPVLAAANAAMARYMTTTQPTNLRLEREYQARLALKALMEVLDAEV